MRGSGTKTAAVLILSIMSIHVAQSQSLGVVLRGGDGSGNTSAPTDDPGWANVGLRGVGCAIYLGNGWVLTAGHVGAGDVTFGSTTYTAQAGTWQRLHDPVTPSSLADIGMFQLSSIPAGLRGVTISTAAPSNGSTITAIGYGRDRGAATTWERHSGFFTSAADRTKRWGENTIDTNGITVNSGYGNTSALKVDFDMRGGSGDNEFQGYYGDSGGAFFYDNGTNWELAGMMVAIGTYTGQPDNMVLYGNATYAADLSVYRSQILPTVIPEPATLSLLALGGLAALRRRHRSVSRTEKKEN